MTTFPSRTWIELNAQVFQRNVVLLKQAINNQQLAVVLKSNAYGHGMVPMAQLAQENMHIDLICVAGLSEAVTLRKAKITKPLLVLSYLDDVFEYAALYNIHCAVYDYETVVQLSKAAQTTGKNISVHVKIDTGMGRLGIAADTGVEFAKQIVHLPGIILHGLFTHLSDTSNLEHSYKQLTTFDSVIDQLTDAGFSLPCTHAISSSGLHLAPKRKYNMVRIGAGLFGLTKTQEHKSMILQAYPYLDLQPIMTWKTHIIQIKTIEVGSYVGYNRTFCATQPTRIAILPVGYFEGYPRHLSNNSIVYVENLQAPVIGVVSMSLMAIDITHIPTASIASEVTLTGNLPGITSHECASRAKVITNEFSTSIKSDIPRIIKHKQAIIYTSSIINCDEIIL